MHFRAVLNRDGGTLRTMDLDAFVVRSRQSLQEAGHTFEASIVSGTDLMEALNECARDETVDVLLAGGGDGTISAAASVLKDNRQILGVLPAGTMNLFARSLGIPLDLDQAILALANAPACKVDIATANGRPFIHLFSVGLHAKLVKLRDEMDYGSRFGKMRASTKAFYQSIIQPPSIAFSLELDEQIIATKAAGLGISNNLFGLGLLPYAEKLDQGRLGVYLTRARKASDILSVCLHLLLRRAEDHDALETYHSTHAVLRIIIKPGQTLYSVIDGELTPLAQETEIIQHPLALNVLRPHAI